MFSEVGRIEKIAHVFKRSGDRAPTARAAAGTTCVGSRNREAKAHIAPIPPGGRKCRSFFSRTRTMES
ncbi:MAG: hypothetical protein CME06_15690 [Gemmatimonadetes bacterium]|nr:hypothetical protein [Gemmatimonadota bacterium]